MLRRRAPLIITAALGLLAAAMLGIILTAPPQDTDAAELDAARREYSPAMLHQRAQHVAGIEGAPEGAGETIPWSEVEFKTSPDGRFTKLYFGALSSFEYTAPDPKRPPPNGSKERIPEFLHRFDRAPVMLVGYMVPLELDERGRAKTFALTQNQQFCCYGQEPKLNEFAVVTVADGVTPPNYTDKPITVTGTFKVGESVTGGYVESLYQMTAKEVLPGEAFAG